MAETTTNIGSAVHDRRVALNMSMSKLASLAGTTKSRICELETGKRPNPTIDRVIKLAAALGVNPCDLLSASPPPPAVPVGVTVKPLEWNPFRAETPFGYYHIDDQTDRRDDELKGRPPFLLTGSRLDMSRHHSLADARAAAQADYDRCVLSALSSALPQTEAKGWKVTFEDGRQLWAAFNPGLGPSAEGRIVSTAYVATPSVSSLEEENRALKAKAERFHGALICIAHTFTEDSHGNMKDYPVSYYRDIARNALNQPSASIAEGEGK